MRLLARISSRLLCGIIATVFFAFYIFWSQIKCPKSAEKLLALASIVASHALGLQVIVDDSQPHESPGEKVMHVFDGVSLFDFLVARVSLGLNSSFIADNSLIQEGILRRKSSFGFREAFRLSKEDADGTRKPFLSVRAGGRRLSLEPWLLACSSRSLIVPWFFDYDEQDLSCIHGEHGFLKLFVLRVARPALAVRAKRGCSSVIGRPADMDKDEFMQKIGALYSFEGCPGNGGLLK